MEDKVILKITRKANVLRYTNPDTGKAFMMRSSGANIQWFPHSQTTITTEGKGYDEVSTITMPLWLANKNKPFLDDLIKQGKITVIQWPK